MSINGWARLVASGLLCLAAITSHAQLSAPGGLPPGFHHMLLDVFTGGPSFYGQASVQESSAPDQQPSTINCSISFLAGKMRVDIDSFDPGTNVPPAEAAKLKNMRSTAIVRPDKNRMYLLYPEFRSYVELTLFKASGTDPVPPPTINKNPLGNEALGTQPCEKSQWNITEGSGERYDVTVWLATNLNRFPIQIRLGPPTALVLFQTLHLEMPNTGLFELPSGYKKYDGIPENIFRNTQPAENTGVQ